MFEAPVMGSRYRAGAGWKPKFAGQSPKSKPATFLQDWQIIPSAFP